MANFSSIVFALILVTLACRVQCTIRDTGFFPVSNEYAGLHEFHRLQYDVSDSKQVPVGIAEEVNNDHVTSSADLPGSFFQKVQDLLVSCVVDGAGGLPALDMTRLQQGGWKLLLDLGLWNPQESDGIDFEEVAGQISSELQQYVGIKAWRNVSSDCLNNTLQFFRDASQGVLYTRQMISSNGELIGADTIYTWNLVSNGNVETCQTVKEWNPDAPFDTQHCSLRYPVTPTDFALIGLCFPANCSESDLTHLFQPVPIFGPYIWVTCVGVYPWKPWSIVTVCILCFLMLLVTMGTVYHVMSRQRKATNAKAEAILEKTKNKEAKQNHSFKEADIELQFSSNETASKGHHNKAFANEEGAVSETNDISSPANHTSGKEKVLHQKMKKSDLIDDIMIGFSSINNGSKIMNTEPMAGNLGALNGIRVISMWWIILGHTFSYALVGYYDNTRFIFDKVTLSFLFNGVINAYVAVDTFFFLSGLLLTYLTLKHLKKSSGRLNWFLFYLHRFIRLTPAYMMSIAIWASLAIHFGQGPAKKNFFEAAADACRKYWWTNLLYINNLYPFPGDLGLQCHSWSWYLANDMQFFIISPIIIYLLYKNAKLGMSLIMVLCLGSFSVTAYLAAYYGAPVGLFPAYNNNTIVVYGSATADIIYGKPYCRIPAYLVGMVFGYIFCQVQGKPFKMSKFLNLFLWFVSTAVGLTIVFGLYRGEGKDIPQYAAVLYTVFSRPAFVMAVGWVAFACVMGYGGPVNSLLSWGVWAPLSRLTYGAYLLHSTILYTIYTSSNAQYHFSYMQWVCMFLANMILAYGAAFLLSIGVEGPFMGLEKALLGGGVRGKKKGERVSRVIFQGTKK